MAFAEEFEGTSNFWVVGGEAGGGEKGGVNLSGASCGKEGAGGGVSKPSEEGEGLGGRSGIWDEERGHRSGSIFRMRGFWERVGGDRQRRGGGG